MCRADQLCIAPTDVCVHDLPPERCALGTCIDEVGRDGCWGRYFDGLCIDVPVGCDGTPDCRCLDTAVSEAVAPRLARCVAIDERGWIVVDP